MTGPPFNAVPFDPGKAVETGSGTATVTFTDGNHARVRLHGQRRRRRPRRSRARCSWRPGRCAAGAPLTAAEKRKDAARFLRQATFGAPREAIDALVAQGDDAWLDEQFAKPAVSHLATVQADPNARDSRRGTRTIDLEAILRRRRPVAPARRRSRCRRSSWSRSATRGAERACGAPHILDVLNRDAFGNFRDAAARRDAEPGDGRVPQHEGQRQGRPGAQTQPDENYAREVMQLFSVGMVMLNVDGTVQARRRRQADPDLQRGHGQGLAKALSGWTYAGQDQTKPWRWLYPDISDPDPAIATPEVCPRGVKPMEPWTATYRSADNTRNIAGPAHDTGAKQLLVYPGAPYSTLPAGQTPQTDLENVIDNLFHHPNVGPFLGKQLIQRLVTSNPSPQYVAAWRGKFNDNGSGVRGDMKAVVRAILLDDEARSLPIAAPAVVRQADRAGDSLRPVPPGVQRAARQRVLRHLGFQCTDRRSTRTRCARRRCSISTARISRQRGR